MEKYRKPYTVLTIDQQVSKTTLLCPVRKAVKKAAIVQCERCFGYHSTRSCVKAAKCRRCASTAHPTEQHPEKSCLTAGPHTCPPRCANCRGPHEATDFACLLRPKRKNGSIVRPTSDQTKAIRRVEAARAALLSQTCQRPSQNGAALGNNMVNV